jgi:tRNA-2-methylthio-N6-dimethylallyladenosine synthase
MAISLRSRGRRARVGQHHARLRQVLYVLHRAVRARSRAEPSADEVIRQVEDAAAEGFKEIVFLGQTVNAYRDGDVDFAELLRRANGVEGIARIRFTSPHPADMTSRAIEAIATCDKVCPQVHLPLQSGFFFNDTATTEIYTIERYEEVVDELRSAIPGLALTTDLIVGFPGETDADFEATHAVMRRIRYDSAFLFKYSARPGAKAAEWPETVDDEEKTRRIQLLIEEQKTISYERNLEMVGREVDVLVEGPAKRDPNQWFGKTEHFKTAVFPRRDENVGETIRIRVAAASPYALFGEGVSDAVRSVEDVTT